ncbi:14035_t:CDS:2 [Cetraspora pellucida]|uniref:14035_t:CDS:1 n=1 Tax=Cetraspora pellucida TaxID=1433469 RepID=A0A9N9N514_9GLOM|nr:14035_t:CDS:2 [Cetraspora pellucida]
MSEENFTFPCDSITFTPPFPPRIDILEIVQKRLEKNPEKIGSKGPNCWLIYRAYYVFEYNKLTNSKKLSMTELSPHIAKAWSNESDKVKKEYQNIAAKVEEELIRQRKENLVYTSPKKRYPSPTIKPALTTDSEMQTAYSEQSIPKKLDIMNSEISSWTLNHPYYASESPDNKNNIFVSEHTMTTDANFPFHSDPTPPYHYQPVTNNLFFIPQYDNYGFNVNPLSTPSILLPAEPPLYSSFNPIQTIYCVDGLYEDNYAFYDPYSLGFPG